MKEHIDFFETWKGEFLGAKKFQNKLIRVWGTEVLDGVEVMNQRFMLYPNIDSSDSTVRNRVLRMCKMLGIKNQIEEADFSPIAGYYLWFNPDKGKETQADLNTELLAEKIDEFCPRYEWKYSTINYVDKTDPTRFDGWTKEQILTYISNDYRNIFDLDNGFVIGDTIEQAAMGKYVLFDTDGEFEVVVISSQVTAIPTNVAVNWRSTERLRYTGLSIDIKYRRVTADTDITKSLITSMLAEQEEYRLKVLAELQKSSTLIPYSEDGDGLYGQKEPTTNLVWYKDRLRLSAIKGTGIRTKDVVDTLLGTLDTGQIKKKVKWYKKMLGPVLIVLAIILAVTPGTQLAAGPVASLAVYMGIAVLVMTVIQAQWAKTNAAAAEYMGRWVKVGNIISIVAGVTAIIQNIGKALAQEAMKEGVTQSLVTTGGMTLAEATSVANGMTAAELAAYASGAGVSSSITTSTLMNVTKQYLTTSWKSVSMKVAEKAVALRQKDMDNDLKDKSEYAQSLEDQLTDTADKNLPFGITDMETFTNHSARLQSRYDNNFPYEAEYATIHIGNIQRSSYAKGAGLNLRAEDLV